MNLNSTVIAGLLLAFANSVVMAATWSEDADAPGHAAAQTYRAAHGAVAVQPLDNSAISLDVAKRMAEALRRRGFTVAGDAPLLLEFETITDSNAPNGKLGALPRMPRVDIGRKRDLGRSDAVDARVEAYSTSRSSILTGVRRQDISVHYTLRATLSDRDGPRLWEGYTEYGEIVSDEARLYSAMATLLAEMVGTKAERRFRLD